MTVILAARSKFGVVLASDQRTVGRNNVTGEHLVFTDSAQKIFTGPNVAVAISGGYQTKAKLPFEVVQDWLAREYRPNEPFRPQIERLYQASFKDGSIGQFLAMRYEYGKAEMFRTHVNAEPEYDVKDDARVRISFAGSGNQLAGDLIDRIDPPLGSFSLQELTNFLAFVIHTVSGIQRYGRRREASVGEGVNVVLLDKEGSHMLEGGYRLDA